MLNPPPDPADMDPTWSANLSRPWPMMGHHRFVVSYRDAPPTLMLISESQAPIGLLTQLFVI